MIYDRIGTKGNHEEAPKISLSLQILQVLSLDPVMIVSPS